MKRMFLTMAALSALTAAVPAAAQNGYGRYGDISVDRRVDQLEYRLEEGIRRGAIARGEAEGLRTQLWEIRRLEGQYGRNGFSNWELSDLDRRILFLGDRLRDAEEPFHGRSDGYDRRYDDRGVPGYDEGYSDRYDDRNDERPGIRSVDPDDEAPYDAGRSYDPGAPRGYDDRDRWGNPPDVDSDRDDYDDSRSGASLPPNDAVTGPLRVGNRAPSGLGPVPPQLRALYPDGNGVYYRYDGDAIYQIDARTDTIRWIGDLPQ